MEAARVQEVRRDRHLAQALVEAARAPRADRFEADLARLLEASAHALDVERVSYWTFEDGQRAIRCLDLYERTPARHSAGARIASSDAPGYFEALVQARAIDAHDACRDPRTREFTDGYLVPLGIGSMLDAPVRVDGRLVGVVCHEHCGGPRTWTSDEQAFAAGMADLVSHALRADELRNERDLARTLLAALSDLGEGVGLIGPEGRLVYANAALARISGFTPDELRALPDPLAALVPADARPLWEERLTRAGFPTHAETFLLHREGTRVPVELVGMEIPTRGRLCVVRDLTERHRKEEAIRLLERLVGSTTDALVWADVRGSVQAWNPGAERLLGWKAEEVVGRPLTVYFPPDLHHEAARLATLLSGGSVPPYETERLHKDGRRVPVSVNLTPLRGPDGKVDAVVALIRDMSAQKALADARRALAQSEKLSALGSLVSGVAHELRTPLTSLQTNLHLAQRAVERALEEAPTDTRRKAVTTTEPAFDAAFESIERIDRLVGDLRRYTRLRSAARREPLPLDVVVGEAVDIFRAAQRGRIKVEADLAAGATVLLDRLGIQQIALNLLQNAAEARPRDGRVRIATRKEGASCELAVEDEGCGMPEDVRERAFDEFFTTKPDGTGLGLSIVGRIVEAHEATIAIESEPGRGTIVRVRFPLA